MGFHGLQQENQVFGKQNQEAAGSLRRGRRSRTGEEDKNASYRRRGIKSRRRSTVRSLYVLLADIWMRGRASMNTGISSSGGRPCPATCCGGAGERRQTACKPGSVAGRGPRDGHSSGTPVTGRLARPTRAAGPEADPAAIRGSPRAAPTWSCSRRGLPCRPRRRARGALLPHPFTLARRPCGPGRAVSSLWHFPWGRPRRALPGSVPPWSPDFPPPRAYAATAAIRPSGPV